MEENFIGYLLEALDPDTHREVEAYLQQHPEAQVKLKTLRRALDPLKIDKLDPPLPPKTLVIDTIARMAEYCCQNGPFTPETPPSSSYATTPAIRRFRMYFPQNLGIFAAAAVVLIAAGLFFPYALHLRDLQLRTDCQKNLMDFYGALTKFRQNHKNKYPNVAEIAPKPKNVSGMIVPLLVKEGCLSEGTIPGCPSVGSPKALAVSYDKALNLNPQDFSQMANRLNPTYGYTLGYQTNDHVEGWQHEDDLPSQLVPLMADAPPVNPLEKKTNSPNHGGKGQNVLYRDGSVKFSPTRFASFPDDDLYLNSVGLPAAGKAKDDSVIGHSGTHP